MLLKGHFLDPSGAGELPPVTVERHMWGFTYFHIPWWEFTGVSQVCPSGLDMVSLPLDQSTLAPNFTVMVFVSYLSMKNTHWRVYARYRQAENRGGHWVIFLCCWSAGRCLKAFHAQMWLYRGWCYANLPPSWTSETFILRKVLSKFLFGSLGCAAEKLADRDCLFRDVSGLAPRRHPTSEEYDGLTIQHAFEHWEQAWPPESHGAMRNFRGVVWRPRRCHGNSRMASGFSNRRQVLTHWIPQILVVFKFQLLQVTQVAKLTWLWFQRFPGFFTDFMHDLPALSAQRSPPWRSWGPAAMVRPRGARLPKARRPSFERMVRPKVPKVQAGVPRFGERD